MIRLSKKFFFIPNLNTVVTGSWDKSLKYWDTRTPKAVATVQLPERVSCMDVIHPLSVVGTADKQLHIFHLSKPDKPYRSFQSPLRYQPRTLACFPDRTGFAIGSIEGRVAINYVDEKVARTQNFAFKCHRYDSQVFAVNNIAFHKGFGTFATAGSDGTYVFWDKDSRHRLKLSEKMNNGITTSTFSRDGRIFAYALSYDWSKGVEGYDKSKPNQILLHAVQDSEIRPKEKKKLGF